MPLSNKPYVCEYCKTGYAKEKTLAVHMCEKKRRALQKDEKRVRHGFYAFGRFYKLSAGAQKEKTYKEFCDSPYYNAFVKFGSFISNVKPLYPEKYIDYVVTSGVKLDHWCNEELYEKYALDLILKEDVTTALERSVVTMVECAKENNTSWNKYFANASTNLVVWHIKDGKISPWLLLNCKSGKAMLGTLNEEQLTMIFNNLNPQHWALRIKRQTDDVALVKEVVEGSNL